MFHLRLVPDNTRIPFMRGRYAGIITSIVLSVLSVGLYFYPGLNYGIDFAGGIVIEARTPEATDFGKVRHVLHGLNMGTAALQEFGSANDVLIRLERQPGDDAAQQRAADQVRATLAKEFPGTQVRRVEAVGASVSGELFRNGMLALGLAMGAMLIYIWFRFEWQFGAGAVVTLLLDVTKTIGFYVLFDLQFNLTAIAAILTIMGYSINDKVVVYDRMRENLRIYKKMPLRELIDLSINETLNRTLGTSLATLLSIIPLAVFGGEALQEFGIVLIFGIFLATSSSIFIAAPILLFLGENRLRRGAPEATAPGGQPQQVP
ncbi:protein translocase subunit SecF [Azospirillum sp. TSO22-1]|uniref:protein translocase subunit SecF n=1 Tax=Azospirillum sp. TSO22-1 TaxID=716789 RepID=UPI000D61F3C0|nr:protein translocase subunit SecF [Azospirillum sp. TSO22-1]PWC55524.1 preprotein translocase subunit SecF [Azospirillum sp. TSO22-1]